MAVTYKAIATVTVGSGGATSIDFTNIPATYTDLVIKISARDNVSAQYNAFNLAFNNSTTSFSQRELYGTGSTVNSGNSATNIIGYFNSNTSTANAFANTEFYIPNYAGSTNKSMSVDSATETNATAALLDIQAALWSNTAAIDRITLTPLSSGTLQQYTTATLYGIKKD